MLKVVWVRTWRNNLSFTIMLYTSVADPWHFDVDPEPDPSVFITDLQDANKKLITNFFSSAYYFLKILLHHFSKIKSQKEVTKQ